MPMFEGNRFGDFGNTAALVNDARNRALRSFVTGLSIDVLVGVTLVLVTYFATANSWGELEWTVLSFSLAKSFVQAAGAFILRRFLDPSGIPTPLPPSDPGEPDEAGYSQGWFVVGVVCIVIVILALFGVLDL